MKTKLFRAALLMSAAALTIFQSCTKEKTSDDNTGVDNERNLTAVKASSDVYFDDISLEVLTVNTENGLSFRETDAQQTCAVVSITPQGTTFPKTVTVDFGSGCTGVNGFVRKGKVIYTITKKFSQTGSVITMSFGNYTVNDHKLEGTFSVTNNGSTTGLNITTTLEDGKITYPDGAWYTKESSVTWVQAAGALTPFDTSDDQFNVSGTGTVVSSIGNTLTATSQGNLLRKFTCYNMVSGKLNLVFNSIAGVLDYGNGECDKAATLTIGTKEYAVTLP